MSREQQLEEALAAFDKAASVFVAESATWADKEDGFHLYFGGGNAVSKWPIKVGDLRELFRAAQTARALLQLRSDNPNGTESQ